MARHSKTTEPEFNRTSSARFLLRRLVRDYLRPHYRMLAIAFLYMGVSAAMTGALAALMQPIIDDVFQAGQPGRLWWVAVAVFVSFSLRGFSSYASAVQMNEIGQSIVSRAQRQLFTHLIRSDLSFLHTSASGQLLSRVVNDVQVMRLAVGECLAGVGSSMLTLIILVSVMFWRDWVLAVASFAVFPLAAYFVARISGRLRRVWKQTQEHVGELSSVMTQTFVAARQVKAYGTEDFEERRIGGMVDQLFRLSTKAFRVSNMSTPVNEILSGIAIVTVIIYGGMQVVDGNSSPGRIFSFITAFLLAYEPIKKITKLNSQLQAGLSASERIFKILDMKPSITDKPDAKELVLTSPTVELENVDFSYIEGQPVLNHVSIAVPAGKTAALVGSSGAGKSSILNLVLRFYDVNGGAVKIGGADVRDITMASLRRHFALVSQEIAIFDESVRANIAYGSEGATEEQIMNAAKAAFAHDFIMSLPLGYDTILGEHGTRLSGGQRQRISIARAMLRDAPILLLDEATSALDSESERAVQAALAELQKGRTTIAIAHRLSTIVDADIIYVMEKGNVIESGAHAALLAQDGTYARLWRLQAGGALAG